MPVLLLLGALAQQGSATVPTPTDGDRFYCAAEYNAAWKKVEKKCLGMTREHALAYKRSSHATLVKRLGAKYGMTEKQIKGSLGFLREKQEEAVRKQKNEEARARAIAERPNRNVEGVVGTLVVPATYGRNYFLYQEAALLFVAQDELGLAKMIREGKLWVTTKELRVRVIERYDYRAIKKGLFLRVRVLDEGHDGEVLFCIPENVASE